MSDRVRAVLTAQLTVSRAQSAARSGDLDRAAKLLDGLDAESVTPATLDLRARVHAQQGELTEADQCWAKVQALAPDDPDAAAGRRVIEEIVAGRRRAKPLVQARRVAVGLAALGVLAAGGLAWTTMSDRPLETVDTAHADTRRADVLEDRIAAMESQRAADEAERAAAQARLADTLATIAGGLRLPGVRVEVRAEDVQVVFERGVFSRSTEITQEGTALLTEVGRRLSAMDVRTTVVGHVVAVPGGRTTGGSVVALARAQVAAGHLAAGGGLPLTAFTLASADQTEGPFPDAARNRTVSLVITPA